MSSCRVKNKKDLHTFKVIHKSPYFIWQLSFVTSAATPLRVWAVEDVAYVNTINESTENNKRHLYDNMTIYTVAKDREQRAEGERICALARSCKKISVLIQKEETR